MSKSTPAAPDYEAAAEAQGQSSREVTEQQTWANRPDQNTPFGQTSWQNTPTWDPSTGQYINRWTQNTTLNDQSQRALDAQMGLTTGRSELAGSMMPRMQDEFGNEMDWSQFDQGGRVVGSQDLNKGYETAGPELDSSQRYNQQANDAIYNQWADRALPQQEEARNQMQTQLYNQGLKPGDQAYDREMQKLGQNQDDAMRQAQYQATIGSGAEAQRMLGMDASTRAQLTGENAAQAGFGNTAMGQQQGLDINQSDQATRLRQQQISEEMSRRGFSLNEINAIISGQQVGMPSMPNFNQAQRSETVQYGQAAQQQGQHDLDAFNAEQQAIQGMMSGAGSMAGGFMMSDRRLKENIRRIGSHNGINIYAFDYIWGHPGVGVMSDEVRHIPGAVVRHSSGYDAVNYEVIYGG